MRAVPPEDGIETFDYIVVGAGAAGSIVAARLAEERDTTVCVIESGPPDRHPYIHLPAGFIKMMFKPDYTWQFRTAPLPSMNGRSVAMPFGRTLGGSASINGMVINRGQAADFDHWAKLGNKGWSYQDVLPYFKKFETRFGKADDDRRGHDGPVPVTTHDWIHPVSEAFIAGAVGLGIPRNVDYNGSSQPGVGYFQRGIHRGRRWSPARTHLWPAVRRTGRIDIRTHSRATRILFSGRRATGVEYIDERNRGKRIEIRARREVIVSAGTINTARLLQISGIGPATLLRQLNVEPVHILAGVGENLRDHCSVRVTARAKNVKTINEQARGLRLMWEAARWAAGRPSLLSTSPSHVHCFWKSQEPLDGADLQLVFTPASYKQGLVSVLDDFPGVSVGLWQHRPESIGHVRALSADVFVDPLINPNYLSSPNDQRVMIDGVRLARRLLRTQELARYIDHETLPDPALDTDDEILNYLREFGATVWHVIGTAKMGAANDPAAVVDDQLRVHGVDGLRVIDASIMPSMPSANTWASTMMIAEKGADLIRGRTSLSV